MTPSRCRRHVLALTTATALLAITACSTAQDDQDRTAARPSETASGPVAAATPADASAGAQATPAAGTAAAESAVPAALRGTPAATWEVGPAGLGDPPVRPPEGFAQATLDRAVAYATGQIVAGNLEEDTVYRRDTEPFLAATITRTRPDYVDTLAAPAAGGRPYTFVSRLPDTALPDGEVRANGRWTLKTYTDDGERYLSLRWRGTFLYPVRHDDGRSTAVVVHRRATWNWADDPTWAPGEDWYFEIGNVDQCATQRSGLLVPDYTIDDLTGAVAKPYGGGTRGDNTEELAERC